MKESLNTRVPDKVRAAICCGFAVAAILSSTSTFAAYSPSVEEDGTIHLPAFSLPESSFLTSDARAAFKAARDPKSKDVSLQKACPSIETAGSADAPAIHKCEADAFAASTFYAHLRERYAVTIHAEQIGGVHTEVFVSTQGIERKNANRVLINVHGGGFLGGWGTNSVLESVPVASIARIKVISVDYREGPEHEFPAASEDVTAVYQQLLKIYKPANIGIYGCSAGGLMTAEAVAWFQKEKLALPGAIAMLCAAASYWSDGDSGYLGRAMEGTKLFLESSAKNPYFKDTKPNDPLAFPAYSPAVIAKFPPSLLITGTRDFALSSVVYTHSLLAAQGVAADLHVWEGLGHAFFYDTDIPESRDAWDLVAKFFDIHLGR